MSDAWKDLERTIAAKLGGRRISRADDFSRSDVDVALPDFPHWKIDGKYRSLRFTHHTLLATIRKKYCKQPHDMAILVTKSKGQHGEVVSMSLDDFATLLAALRGARDALEHELRGIRWMQRDASAGLPIDQNRE